MPYSQANQHQLLIRDRVEFLDAMASRNRLAILNLLVEKELSVGKMSEIVGVSNAALSQHLAKLRGAGLVSYRREAQTIYYRSESPAVRRMLVMLNEVFPADPQPISDSSAAVKRVNAELARDWLEIFHHENS